MRNVQQDFKLNTDRYQSTSCGIHTVLQCKVEAHCTAKQKKNWKKYFQGNWHLQVLVKKKHFSYMSNHWKYFICFEIKSKLHIASYWKQYFFLLIVICTLCMIILRNSLFRNVYCTLKNQLFIEIISKEHITRVVDEKCCYFIGSFGPDNGFWTGVFLIQ